MRANTKLLLTCVLVTSALSLTSGPLLVYGDHTALFEITRKFANPGPALGGAFVDRFGASFAFAGSNILVSAPWEDLGGRDSGVVYLFDGLTGAVLQTFRNPDPTFDDEFGVSITSTTSMVIVGAPSDDTAGPGAGAVYIFDIGEEEGLPRRLSSPSFNDFDRFGSPVVSSETGVFVGAVDDDTAGLNAGAVYLFDPTTETLLMTFLNPAPNTVRGFGRAIAFVGEMVAIGAFLSEKVYLFDVNSGELVRTLNKPTPGPGFFGLSIAEVDGNIVVGAPAEDVEGVFAAGAAYVFEAKTGSLLSIIRNPAPGHLDNFGSSVAALGSMIMIGSPRDSTGGELTGSFYIFSGQGEIVVEVLTNPEPGGDRFFGARLTVNNGHILVGAPKRGDFGEDHGAVYLYRFAGSLVEVDVRPESGSNVINPSSSGRLPVAVLTSEEFETDRLDLSSLKFGRTGSEASPVRFWVEDVDGDGDLDVKALFNVRETGLQTGDTAAVVTGRTLDGAPIIGFDSVRVLCARNCRGQ